MDRRRRYQDVIRAEDALARAEWSRAHELLRGVMPVENPFGEFELVPLLTLDFAEAAWHAGRPAEARAHVTLMRDAGCAQLSTHAALITVGAPTGAGCGAAGTRGRRGRRSPRR